MPDNTDGLDLLDPVNYNWAIQAVPTATATSTSNSTATGAINTVTGTTHQVSATTVSGAVTLGTPQDIDTVSNVQFASIGVGRAAPGTAGVIDLNVGLRIGGAAASGHVLIGNGTNYVDGTITASPVGAYTARAVGTTVTSNSATFVTGSSQTFTLPAAPADGDYCIFVDGSSVTGTIIARNGKTIMGLSSDMTVDVPDFQITLIYRSATGDWRIAA